MDLRTATRGAAFRARNLALRAAVAVMPTPPLPDPLPDRIHYGCGRNVMDGWLNVDGVTDSFPGGGHDAKRVHPVDLAGQQPFRDGAFLYGFAEDFIEHLAQADALTFLVECRRVIRPGGVLRLSFPGLRGVLDKHYSPPTFQAALAAKRDAYTMWGHHHFFCLESLDLVCRHIGFTAVREVPFGESEHEALRGLETRADQIGLNLTVEVDG